VRERPMSQLSGIVPLRVRDGFHASRWTQWTILRWLVVFPITIYIKLLNKTWNNSL
jgi:hypothetical protein